MAGAPAAPGSALSGGLPIRPNTESEPVRSGDLRDAGGALKRHAARFRIFAYPAGDRPEAYPRGDGVEIAIGSRVGGKTVVDIYWSVHLANKKANQFVLSEGGADGIQGIAGYEDGNLPPIRNPGFPTFGAPQPPVADRIATLGNPLRTAALVIDPGPRAIAGEGAGPVAFDRATTAAYYDGSRHLQLIADYPKSFPADHFPGMHDPIETLGELRTDSTGRLLVLGGYGRAATWLVDGKPGSVDTDVNNDQWFDDCSDGPVSAVIAFDDGSLASAADAWVTATDPSFAPQIRNIVTLWEDIYDSWVRTPELNIAPQIYDVAARAFQSSYKPSFEDQVAPIFQSTALQEWTINLNPYGMKKHTEVGQVTAEDPSAATKIFQVLRNPDDPSQQTSRFMPLHLGDANHSFLSLRDTQYFFLSQWNAGQYVAAAANPLGGGEYLDMAVLANCLGGRFSPGIDLTFVMREASVYVPSWRSSGTGPFRINAKKLAYAQVMPHMPLLTVGYVPRQNAVDLLEPGDLSKFMAIPWHTDYNSCATHLPSPNPTGNKTLFWSWPAQRPVAVYVAADVAPGPDPSLPAHQRWSVRGPGTSAKDPKDWGRYQDAHGMLTNWNLIGVVLQASQIDGLDPGTPANWYLETEGLLENAGSDPVQPFPNKIVDVTDSPQPTDGPRPVPA
jgi:hypothetical protein